MSQAALAKEAFITQGTLSRIEAGRLRPDIVTARRLSGALGLTYEELTRKVEVAMERARTYATKVTQTPSAQGGLDALVSIAGAVGIAAIVMLAVAAIAEEEEPRPSRRRSPRKR